MVYLAQDRFGTPVVIKEYLPAALELRTEDSHSPAVAKEHEAAFRYGMRCFFEEGRTLAGLVHPNVVRVLSFFRANGTVYMVMEYERGRTLQEYILKHPGGVRESTLRAIFARLLNGLREVHAQKLLHLDIKPSNIYLRVDGTPVLLDFGAARQTLSAEVPMLKPMFTPGFAAPEKYRDRHKLGPWTDIYSVGASLYACLAGKAPQAAEQRLKEDTLVPAARQWDGRYSRQLLDIIDWCMHLDPLARPQSVFALQRALADRSREIPDAAATLDPSLLPDAAS